jgi:hypothetical protein
MEFLPTLLEPIITITTASLSAGQRNNRTAITVALAYHWQRCKRFPRQHYCQQSFKQHRTGKHYAINLNATTTSHQTLIVFNGTGTGFVFGFNGASDQTALLLGSEYFTGSKQPFADPQYIAPTGTSATVDLHIHPTNATPIESAGIAIVIGNRMTLNGQTRASFTPTDIGADAGNFQA